MLQIPKLGLVRQLSLTLMVSGENAPQEAADWLRSFLHEVAAEFDSVHPDQLLILMSELLDVNESVLGDKRVLLLALTQLRPRKLMATQALHRLRAYVEWKPYPGAADRVAGVVFVLENRQSSDRLLGISITVESRSPGEFKLKVAVDADLGFPSRMQIWNRLLIFAERLRVRVEYEPELRERPLSRMTGPILLEELMKIVPSYVLGGLNGSQLAELLVSVGENLDPDENNGQGRL